MKKMIVAMVSIACFCLIAGPALSKTMPQFQDHRKRLMIVQSIVSDIALNDLDKAAKDANVLLEMVSKDSEALPPESLRDANTTLEKSIRMFLKVVEKKDPLAIVGGYCDIIGNCYGCHTKYRDPVRATHTP